MTDQYSRHYRRLRAARKEAEQLLELKSRELFEANRRLTQNTAELEKRVGERTAELVSTLKELAKSRDEALQASEMKSRFLANMSHEIRTPLNGIVGSTSLLMDGAVSGFQRELIATLQTSSETLLHIVNDILDFSKIETGMLELESRDVDLQSVCDDILNLFRQNALDQGLQLEFKAEPSPLPWIVGDAIRLRQLISNLLSNAIKFTKAGRIELCVSVNERAGSGVVIRVIDTGVGISQADQERLFEAFTQADTSTTRQYGGTGLGLAICVQLAGIMGGTLEVDSELNQGSTFTLKLPLDVSEDPNRVPAPVQTQARIDAELRGGVKVLLVDDNRINRSIGARLVESIGCEVSVASSGEEAIKASVNGDFDMVLMDIQMPGMDGVEAQAGIRGSCSNPPFVVALTAHALLGDRERYIRQGFDEYLEKPLNRDRLRDVIHFLLPSDSGDSEGEAGLAFELSQLVLLNRTCWEEFIELIGDQYSELRDEYLKDLASGSKEIKSLIGHDWEAVRTIAHRLRSASGYIGAERAKGIMVWLETAGEQAEPDLQSAVAELAIETAKATTLALQH